MWYAISGIYAWWCWFQGGLGVFGIPVDSSMLSSPDDDNEDIELWRGVVLLMDLGVGFVVIQLVCGNGMDVRVYLHIQYGRSDILL